MYEYDFHTYSVKRKKSKKKLYVWLLVFAIIGTLMLINSFNKKKTDGKVISPVVSEISSLAKKIGLETNLRTVVQQQLQNKKGSYAVAIKNLNTGESYYFNEHTVYESGSLYKLWIMAVVFEQIKAGKIKEDSVLESDVAALNKKFHIATESAELTDGKVSFTVASALRQMITISHNYAALLLTEKIGLSQVKAFLAKNGFTQSKVGIDNTAPQTTAFDIALFYEKLYKGQLEDGITTYKMLDLLKAQALNNKLPKYLPQEVVIAHKTGELGLYSHDGGIIYSPDGDYIIVILSRTNYPPEAEEEIAMISKAVYEYFSTQE